MSFSVLYWISGLPGSRSVIRGTWSRDPPRVLISEANFHRPSSLQYDVSSNRYNEKPGYMAEILPIRRTALSNQSIGY